MKNTDIKIIFFGNFPFGGPSANLIRNFALSLNEISTNHLEIILPVGRYYGRTVDKDYKRKGKFERIEYKHMCFKNHPRNYFGKMIDILFGLANTMMYLILSRIKRKNNITILFNTDYLLLFMILRKVLNNKLIIILPEFYEKPGFYDIANAQKFSLRSLKWQIFNFNMKHVIKFADGFFVASYYLKDYLQETLKSKKKIYVLPNVIDPSIFEMENVKPFLENKITIGYTGTPSKKDGVIDLITSFSILNKKFPNTHLLIIGDMTDGTSLLPQLKKFANEQNIESSITFTGLVLYNKIPGLLNSCQILALTRPNGVFAEAGFPTKLGEYFSCKKPVLITKVGDIPKYFKNEEHVILVEPENIESIVSGFEKILTDKNLSEKIGLNGYKWMDENLNYINQSNKISEFLHQ